MVTSTGPTSEDERLLRGYSGRMFLVVAMGRSWRISAGRPTTTLTRHHRGAGDHAGRRRVRHDAHADYFAACQYPSGRVADAVSRKIAIVIGLGGMIAGFAVLTQVPSYPVFLLSTALLGVGSAFFFVSERVLLSDLFVAKRGRAFGLNSAISRVGSILAAGLAVVALSVGPWQLAFAPVVGLLLVILVLFHLVSREPYGTPTLFRMGREGGGSARPSAECSGRHRSGG